MVRVDGSGASNSLIQARGLGKNLFTRRRADPRAAGA